MKGGPAWKVGDSSAENSLVVLRLVHLDQWGENVVDQFLHPRIDIVNIGNTGGPLSSTAQIIEGTDDLQKTVSSTLPDTIVVVRQLSDELHGALLDIRKEVVTSVGADGTDGVASNLLLNADGAVDVENLVEVDVNSFDVNFPIVLDLDSGGRR